MVLDLQGRLIDHVRNTQSIGLEDLQILVLDEADRLLEMGFSEEVSAPIQTLLWDSSKLILKHM